MIALFNNRIVESSILVWSPLNKATEPERNKSGITDKGFTCSAYTRAHFAALSMQQIIGKAWSASVNLLFTHLAIRNTRALMIHKLHSRYYPGRSLNELT